MSASLEAAVRWYRRLLLLCPGTFRARYCDEMEELFAADYREAATQGRGELFKLWIRFGFDLCRALPREWVRELPRASRGPLILGLLAGAMGCAGAKLNHELGGVLLLSVGVLGLQGTIIAFVRRGFWLAASGAAVLSGPMVFVITRISGLWNPPRFFSPITLAALVGFIAVVLSTAALLWTAIAEARLGPRYRLRGSQRWIIPIGTGAMVVGLGRAEPDRSALFAFVVIFSAAGAMGSALVRTWRKPGSAPKP